MEKKCVVAILCIGVIFASNCLADDLLPPSWRGEANSTFQMWEFGNSNIPADLSAGWFNPYGTPQANINNPFNLVSWLPSYNAGGNVTAYGIWKLYAGTLILDIPNTLNTDPDSSKEIWLQITYFDPYGAGLSLPIDVNPDYAELTRERSIILDTNFTHDTYKIILKPNPLEETITISPIQCQLYVDQIVIDTICVPEPATIMLLGLAGLLIRKRIR